MPARALVVDDHLLNVKLLEARLQIVGLEVETAFSGAEALTKIESFRPDIVLLDVMMPGMDGYEVCRRIRRNPDTANLPVVMVTALDKPADRATGLEAGADDFLVKPVSDELLIPTIERLLRSIRPPGALAAQKG